MHWSRGARQGLTVGARQRSRQRLAQRRLPRMRMATPRAQVMILTMLVVTFHFDVSGSMQGRHIPETLTS